MSALTTKAGQRAAEDFIAPDRLRSNLIDEVKAVCARLAPLGWAALFRTHGLNIEAADLSSELARPLSFIDREQPGFGDFCVELSLHAPRSASFTMRSRLLRCMDGATGATRTRSRVTRRSTSLS